MARLIGRRVVEIPVVGLRKLDGVMRRTASAWRWRHRSASRPSGRRSWSRSQTTRFTSSPCC